IRDNIAEGVDNSPDPNVEAFGGGVRMDGGRLDITRASFTGNTIGVVGNGAALSVVNTVTAMDSSTFQGNAGADTSVVLAEGSSNVSVRVSTFSGNSASGTDDAVLRGGTFDVALSTFVADGSIVGAATTASVRGSILQTPGPA